MLGRVEARQVEAQSESRRRDFMAKLFEAKPVEIGEMLLAWIGKS
jgi:hypothetical protein